MSERGHGQGGVRPGPPCSHSFLPLCPHCLHSGPPAGWLQPTLAIPLQDLSSIELGLAGQSLRLEWATGAGGCVLLPRDARHCRAFLEELTGERGKGEEGGWGGGRGPQRQLWCPQRRQPGNGTHPSWKFRSAEDGKVLRGWDGVFEGSLSLAGSVQMSCSLCPPPGGAASAPRRRR